MLGQNPFTSESIKSPSNDGQKAYIARPADTYIIETIIHNTDANHSKTVPTAKQTRIRWDIREEQWYLPPAKPIYLVSFVVSNQGYEQSVYNTEYI